MAWCPRPREDITRRSPVSTCDWSPCSSGKSCPKGTGPPVPTCCSSATGTVTCRSATTAARSSCPPPPGPDGFRPTSSRFPDANKGRPCWPALECIGPSRRSAREQGPPELGHPPPHRAIVNPLTHPEDGPTQDLRIDSKGREHLLP